MPGRKSRDMLEAQWELCLTPESELQVVLQAVSSPWICCELLHLLLVISEAAVLLQRRGPAATAVDGQEGGIGFLEAI